MLKQILFAATVAAFGAPALAETKPGAEKKTEPAVSETKPAEEAAGEKKPSDKEAGDKKAEEKKELTPEEQAALAAKEAEIAAAKAKAMGEGEPRALIVDILGFSEPKIDAFEELNDGASILLEAKAEITMTYYPTCEDLMIRGGRIQINGDKLTLDNGEIVSRDKVPCPGSVRLSPADVVNASVVTRSTETKPTISLTPRLLGVAGPGAGNYTKIGVYGAEGAIFEAPLKGRGAAWPKDAGALEPGKQYTIVLTGPDTQMFAARVIPDENASPVTVFRIK